MTDGDGLELDGVVVAPYGAVVLPETSVLVPPGSSLAVLGEAGSGKSSALAVLGGRQRAASGAIRFRGSPVEPSRVGFVEQQHYLPDGLTAAEHLVVPLLARGASPDGWTGIERLLSELGLPPSAHHNLLEELSGGQQQRVAVARALVGEPGLVCLDDPVSELDGASAELVWAALARAAGNGAVVVVATPRPDEAERLDRVLEVGGRRG